MNKTIQRHTVCFAEYIKKNSAQQSRTLMSSSHLTGFIVFLPFVLMCFRGVGTFGAGRTFGAGGNFGVGGAFSLFIFFFLWRVS